jgi:hypothetical protein
VGQKRRRTQGEIAQRQRKRVLTGVVVLVTLLTAFVVTIRLVPGSVTRDVVGQSVGRSLEAVGQPKCQGPLTAMRCVIEDGSGSRASYLVSTSKSCWRAALSEGEEQIELPAQVQGCMHVHLWDNIF